MKVEDVEFYSQGDLVRGVLKYPDGDRDRPWPIIVQGPGWLEVVGDPLSLDFHAGLVAAGYAVLQFDFRGFGRSEGEPGMLDPRAQQFDIRNAITYVSTRDDLDIHRLGLFALGGLAGGNAIYVARHDRRVKAICAQSVVADGVTWLREQRREWEWIEFLQRIEDDRRRRVLENVSDRVDPTEELMVSTPERKKKGMPLRGKDFYLSSVDYLAEFRPVEIVSAIAPCALLMTAIVNDVVTPEHHARSLFAAAGGPKKLILQQNVTHYQGYTVNFDILMKHIVQWFGTYLVSGERPGPAETVSEFSIIE